MQKPNLALLELMVKFLKAGYVDDCILFRSESGTPQNSMLSPMLASIILHYVLDTWFYETVKSSVSGFCELVGYSDDSVPYRQVETVNCAGKEPRL